ncbi:MAG: hypothetical protein A2Y62_21370 [Candidatus Fischerbacteria bacterium RBG_13_37_8]|uniref:Myosin heavy chain n=1 Tax=Candidatus Fischerbacteria bacterium RBG_13_37_8 TaxID=1817863 RepID=A0A1F5VTT1_9BACT|nr:MAG: hypothetical protein A2Y62_21370 [Candidatus Fischerbacteria bacterium RBG_13_37_8]
MEQEIQKPDKKLSKQQLLEEYDRLYKKYHELVINESDIREEHRCSDEKITVEKASQYTVEYVIKSLAELNVSINKALADLSDKLAQEAGKLTELRKAIEIETKNLKEIHQIDNSAHALKALLKAQNEEKAAFEIAMEIKHKEWEDEQKKHDLELKERNLLLKKEREREQEDYDYNLALSRKKESDAYEEKKNSLDKELEAKKITFEKEASERLSAITQKETEYNELKQKVTLFPQELEETVKKGTQTATDKIKNDYEVKIQLMLKEIEGERKLFELKIASLNEQVTKQAAQIEALNHQLNNSNKQVQDIAVKAIEGASGFKALSSINEIALEQAKNISSKKP